MSLVQLHVLKIEANNESELNFMIMTNIDQSNKELSPKALVFRESKSSLVQDLKLIPGGTKLQVSFSEQKIKSLCHLELTLAIEGFKEQTHFKQNKWVRGNSDQDSKSFNHPSMADGQP